MKADHSRLALVSLACMLFCFLTSEVFAAGALLPMSRDLGIPSAQTGLLVTAYAGVAAVAIVPMDRLTRGWAPRWLLAGAMIVLAVSHVVMGLAPSFAWVLGARTVAAVFHGVVWASAPVVAVGLMPDRAARATGAVFVGSAVANVLGAPLVATLSAQWSWRWASQVLAAASLVCAGVLAAVLPRTDATMQRQVGAVGDDRSRRAVVVWCALVVLIATAHLMAFTFVTESARAAGISAGGVPLLLLVMGVAGLVGTLVIGRFHDRFPSGATLAGMVVMAIGVAMTALPRTSFFVGAALWSLAYAALTVALQAMVIRDAPTWSRTASAWYVLAFQIGIGIGAAVGGVHLGSIPQQVGRAVGASLFVLVAAGLAAVRLRDRTSR